mmetsp:Transcript_7969/g.19545  ORF Transcript_7969/g.19545 Transcript_7969/m.19545 type:complete len:121 (+) Transcript_7969:599-961(+)
MLEGSNPTNFTMGVQVLQKIGRVTIPLAIWVAPMKQTANRSMDASFLVLKAGLSFPHEGTIVFFIWAWQGHKRNYIFESKVSCPTERAATDRAQPIILSHPSLFVKFFVALFAHRMPSDA